MAKDYTYFDKETSVEGELTTMDLVVEGSFKGKICAEKSIMLKKTARVNADIDAQKLMVEEGAFCNGKIQLRNGSE